MYTTESFDENLPELNKIMVYFLDKLNLSIDRPFKIRKDDKNPSCTVGESKSKNLFVRDWGSGDIYDAIDIATMYYSASISKIDRRIAIGLIKKEKKYIDKCEVNLKGYTNEYKYDMVYEELKLTDSVYFLENNISPVEAKKVLYRLNYFSYGEKSYIRNREDDLAFILKEPIQHKDLKIKNQLFKPYNIKGKRYRNMPGIIEPLIGITQINLKKNYIIVTKGIKDYLVLAGIYNVISVLSETNPTIPALNVLNKYFKNVCILFDKDEAGEKYFKILKNEYPFIKKLTLLKDGDLWDNRFTIYQESFSKNFKLN